MENKYSLIRKKSELWRSLRDGDFEEEEVWDVVKDRNDYISEIHKPKDNKDLCSLVVPRSIPIPIASRMIPRTSSGSSSASSSHETKAFQQSAPVNIPEWSKIYGNKVNKTNVKNVSMYNNDYDYDYYDNQGDYDDDGVVVNHHGNQDEEEEDDEYNTKLPPHEFIARRLARSQISSFSVFEGAGRTLKGRDLSKLRNSVLIKTGFLESL
ncbi:uncharacterized protein [Cicer arietinum]|uniref:Uncharacterized protein LOC101488981 n=1 Tax=Cicer arietinum TaxID=3827 RepID=A0A1S2Y670_CICAR|nr:uncharacterized protein LOC101488981 [Cicer arietinum]